MRYCPVVWVQRGTWSLRGIEETIFGRGKRVCWETGQKRNV